MLRPRYTLANRVVEQVHCSRFLIEALQRVVRGGAADIVAFADAALATVNGNSTFIKTV